MTQDNPLALSFKGKSVRHEKIFEEEVKRILRLEFGCDVEKLHGSEFQMGLPDLLVLHDERFILLELKWTNVSLSTVGEVFDSLKGRQRGLIPLWGKKGAPIWILTGFKINKEIRAYLTHAANRDWNSPANSYPLRRAMLLLLKRDQDSS